MKKNPLECNSYAILKEHAKKLQKTAIKDLFKSDKNRFKNFSITHNDILFDFSKNSIDAQTIHYARDFMEEIFLKKEMEAMRKGEKINETEKRAVLHSLLRSKKEKLPFDLKDKFSQVSFELEKIKKFSQSIFLGKKKGFTGKPINTLVNIGIGGSDLGPKMVIEALDDYKNPRLQSFFVSNIDSFAIEKILKQVNPEETLFIICSKTFTTQETLTNANTAREWFLLQGGKEEDIAHHFVAVSTNEKEVKAFGIHPDGVFYLWDWVGGRFSLWSSVGLIIACMVGFDNFKKLLEGGSSMDEHFFHTEFEKNIPVMMAFLSFWYTHFFHAHSHALIPYDERLHLFPSYLQQLLMESNGKSIDRNGEEVNYPTQSILWGATGTDAQHSFFQLLHQGTHLTPLDFIFCVRKEKQNIHHSILAAHFFSQTEALMVGKSKEEVLQELSNIAQEEKKQLANYKICKGNQPTNTFLLKNITPSTLGSLIAAYEHKTFVLGIFYNIFSFDQWGVELGKQMSKKILKELQEEKMKINEHDSSTIGLMEKFLEWK